MSLTICLPHWKRFDIERADLLSTVTTSNPSLSEGGPNHLVLQLRGTAEETAADARKIVAFYARRGWAPMFKRLIADGGKVVDLRSLGAFVASWERMAPVEKVLGRHVREGKVVVKVWGWFGKLTAKGGVPLRPLSELNDSKGRNTSFRAGLDSEEQLNRVQAALDSLAVRKTKDYVCRIVRLTDMHDPLLREYNVKTVDGMLKVTLPLGKRWTVDIIHPSLKDLRIAVSAEIQPTSPPPGLVEAATEIFDNPNDSTLTRTYGGRYTNSPYHGATSRRKVKYVSQDVSYMLVEDYREGDVYYDVWVKANKGLNLAKGFKVVGEELMALRSLLL